MNRAYSVLEVRRVDEDKRIVEGIATTPSPDRMGDIVEPLGVTFKNPLPLLWQHDASKPVGTATFGKPTKDGVTFRARVESISEPGVLKDRLDEAWQSVKTGLVRGVSIGFRAIERSLMKDGGVRFLKSEVLELSLVTIPANADATITTVKSADRELRAAFGRTTATIPGASGTAKPKTAKGANDMFAKKIADLEAEIGPKRLRMKNILEAAADDGDRDLDESEAQEFDELSEEVKGLEVKLSRLQALDSSAKTARPVTSGDRPRDTVPAQPKAPVEKGIRFARYVMCFAHAKGNTFEALEIAKNRYPRDKEIQQILKSAVAGGTTTDPSWAAPLVQPTDVVSEFVEYLRPMTIVGKFGSGNVPSLRRVPFNIRVPAQTSGGSANWVGEGAGKPVTKFDFDSITLRWTKVAAISVLSEDLLRFSSPSAELLVRNSLAEALVEKLDQDFANPSVTEIQDVRPAAITQGAQNSVSSGVDAAAVRADIKTAVSYFIANNIPTAGLVVLMRHAQALSLSLMRNPLGVKEFPDMTMNGGILEGMPVIASQYMPQGVVAFVSADNVYLADDGGVAVDMSREASLEMDTAPTQVISDGSPLAPTPAQLVSMFQTNSVAIRAERMINWKRRRSAAVYYLTSTGWGNEDTSPAQAAI